ncbi:putative signaling protein [bioreactor metagenome]|uniref:Putative signaling protein n=1 Tax=bioreactor metagenome TaxID=1076179 RepID=A0A645DJU5_9ZZZZ
MVRIDIDNFKMINEMYGFEEGDFILKKMERLITEILSGDDLHCRLGGDDFLALLKYSSDADVIEKGTVFRKEFSQFLEVNEKRYTLNFTTGIYHIPANESDIDKIVDRATMAHNYSKQLPNERKFSFYREDMREKAIRDKDIEDVMGAALKNGEFRVFLQPRYNIDSGKMEGAEALVRWFKNGKMMLPSEFIPVFEKNGFIVNVDLFVLDEVCRLQRQWLDEGINPLPISVNQSKPLIYGNDYVKKLKSTVEKYNIPPRLIELELLETIIHDDIVRLTDTIRQLRDYGFLICIDDFGNGYSSLNLLKDIYADVLKVDRGFLSDAETNIRAGQVLKSIIL